MAEAVGTASRRYGISQNEVIRVTVSIGVAMLGEADRTSLDLIRRADDKLYEAKRGGRNRVTA